MCVGNILHDRIIVFHVVFKWYVKLFEFKKLSDLLSSELRYSVLTLRNCRQLSSFLGFSGIETFKTEQMTL